MIDSMIDSPHFRAVFDTNIIISALKSKNPNSPTVELISRWLNGEFTLTFSDPLRYEYVEKMVAKRIEVDERDWFLAVLNQYGEHISLPDEWEQIVVDDPDDDIVIGTALAGGATHLVTYDQHLLSLGSPFRGIEIVKGLPFLYAVRGDVPPHTNKKS